MFAQVWRIESLAAETAATEAAVVAASVARSAESLRDVGGSSGEGQTTSSTGIPHHSPSNLRPVLSRRVSFSGGSSRLLIKKGSAGVNSSLEGPGESFSVRAGTKTDFYEAPVLTALHSSFGATSVAAASGFDKVEKSTDYVDSGVSHKEIFASVVGEKTGEIIGVVETVCPSLRERAAWTAHSSEVSSIEYVDGEPAGLSGEPLKSFAQMVRQNFDQNTCRFIPPI